jgi:hypothetical protein
MNNPLVSFLFTRTWRLPYLIIPIVGICICLVRWKQNPKVSSIALIAFLLSIVNELVWVCFGLWNFLGESRSAVKYLIVFKCVAMLLYILSQILLLIAIFGWRSSSLTNDS